MKKNNVKAFTLVEMLIVIVIIGILIASLMPRMQSAQGRARDVARKNDLAQIQTAIITSQQDRGDFPGTEGNPGYSLTGGKRNDGSKTTGASEGLDISSISENLIKAGMSSIPTDPNKANKFKGIGSDAEGEGGQYRYIVAKRNNVKAAGFALMAKTEVEGSSNYVVCNSGADAGSGTITSDTDLANIQLCTTVTQVTSSTGCGGCNYTDPSELRYLVLY